MALLLWQLLISIPIPLAWAGPISTPSLSPYLTQYVPVCAYDCLQSFISDNFPTNVCSPKNFNCLCITPSVSGHTLGEGALLCLALRCPPTVESVSKSVYQVCTDIPGRQLNTRSKLSTNIVPSTTDSAQPSSFTTSLSNINTPSSGLTSSATEASTQPSTSNTTSSIEITTITATNTPSLHSPTPSLSQTAPPSPPSPNSASSTASSSSPTTSITCAATSSAPFPPNSGLTDPQLAGVVIASVGAAALACGFCFLLLFYRRRRRQRRNSDSSFVGDKVVDTAGTTSDMAPPNFAPSDQPQNMSPPRAPHTGATPAFRSEGGWQKWARNTHPNNIGLSLDPNVPGSSKGGISPVTPESHRTNSQLLPLNPTYSLFPPPLRTESNSRRDRQPLRAPASEGYAPDKPPPVSGPSFPSSMDTSQAHLQERPSHRSLSDPFYETPKKSPSQGYKGVRWTDSASAAYKPLPPRPPPSARDMRPPSSKPQRASLPRTFPLPPPIETQYSAAIERQYSRKNTARKKSNSSSQYTHFSNGSETSFEDADEDMPLAAKSALSPVTETRSPPQRSSKVVYPPMPPSASESPTRIIKRPRPYGSESLLAKRRGDEKAAELARGMPSSADRRSAKWQILVGPGLESLENAGPSSPRTPRNEHKTPSKGK